MTRFVLKETLGKLPLFAQQLDPEFQMEVFPLIKPVSYAKHEVVFQRGEPSRDLIFLLKGEVKVLSPLDGNVSSLITPTQEIVLAKPTAKNKAQEPVMQLEHSGCFGETVLTGRRRQYTHVAAAWCETLVLTKDDLIVLFEKNPRAGKRIVKTLLAEVERKEKLQLLLLRFIIGSLPHASPVRNALVIQKAWSRYAARIAAANQNTAASLYHEKTEASTQPGSISTIINDAAQMGAALDKHHGVTPDQVCDVSPHACSRRTGCSPPCSSLISRAHNGRMRVVTGAQRSGGAGESTLRLSQGRPAERNGARADVTGVRRVAS